MQQMLKCFPKQPYQVQKQLASQIYSSLQGGKDRLIIAQSPTGTGKTYSVLVPIMHWVKSNPTSMVGTKSSKIPPWVKKSSETRGETLFQEKQQQLHNLKSLETISRPKRNQNNVSTIGDIEDLGGYVSGDDGELNKSKKRVYQDLEKDYAVEAQGQLPLLIFVTRTHSQIQQIMDSIKEIPIDLKAVELASKEFLCVNQNLKGTNLTEKCRCLLSVSHCHYFSKAQDLKAYSFKEFFNIDAKAANELGKKHALCPYYAVKNHQKLADIVAITYSSILNPKIRKNLQLRLQNAIIVFDQAHNVINETMGVKSHEITMEQIERTNFRIQQYLQKYGAKMKKANLDFVDQFLQVLKCLKKLMQKYSGAKKPNEYVKIQPSQLCLELNFARLNILGISNYFKLSNFAQKVAYFDKKTSYSSGTLDLLIEFLTVALTEGSQNISMLIKINKLSFKNSSFKILCTDSTQLDSIIDSARLTLFVGGTMEPLSDYQRLQLKYQNCCKILKYGHIIDQDQCRVFLIGQFKERKIIFDYQNCKNTNYLKFLGEMVVSVLQHCLEVTRRKEGIVIFIQNYRMLDFFRETLSKLSETIPVFFDVSGKDIFPEYKKTIEEDKKGGILVSVMGGKLSEGINFADHLARKLIVFGLPFANAKAPEIIEMKKYYDEQQIPNYNGNVYYLNLCAKTLNQTIGRAIRHRNDYADIYLIDDRFSSMRDKLSNWLQSRCQTVGKLEGMIS